MWSEKLCVCIRETGIVCGCEKFKLRSWTSRFIVTNVRLYAEVTICFFFTSIWVHHIDGFIKVIFSINCDDLAKRTESHFVYVNMWWWTVNWSLWFFGVYFILVKMLACTRVPFSKIDTQEMRNCNSSELLIFVFHSMLVAKIKMSNKTWLQL